MVGVAVIVGVGVSVGIWVTVGVIVTVKVCVRVGVSVAVGVSVTVAVSCPNTDCPASARWVQADIIIKAPIIDNPTIENLSCLDMS
jgi:hypothetical protein